jgi:hypothetical protein
MGLALHLGALGTTVLGGCCLLANRRHAGGVRGVILSLLMVIAMADAAAGAVLLAPIAWSGLLLAAAIASLAAPGRRAGVDERRIARAHGAIGAIVMALLLILMTGSALPAGAVEVAASGHHAGPASALTAAGIVGAAGYAAASVLIRRARRVDRVQQASMGLSVLLMGAALVAG